MWVKIPILGFMSLEVEKRRIGEMGELDLKEIITNLKGCKGSKIVRNP
jgi:hypothetical protein